jgi:hypothetical protein
MAMGMPANTSDATASRPVTSNPVRGNITREATTA